MSTPTTLSRTLRDKYDADIKAGGRLSYPRAQEHICAVAAKLKAEITAWLDAGNATGTSKAELRQLDALRTRCQRDIDRNDPTKPPKQQPCVNSEEQPLMHRHLSYIAADDDSIIQAAMRWSADYATDVTAIRTAKRINKTTRCGDKAAIEKDKEIAFNETRNRYVDKFKTLHLVVLHRDDISDNVKTALAKQSEKYEQDTLYPPPTTGTM
jgi:hypothetical protein